MNLFFKIIELLLLKLQLCGQHFILKVFISLFCFETPVEDSYKTYKSYNQVYKDQDEEKILYHWRDVGRVKSLIDDHASINN